MIVQTPALLSLTLALAGWSGDLGRKNVLFLFRQKQSIEYSYEYLAYHFKIYKITTTNNLEQS